MTFYFIFYFPSVDFTAFWAAELEEVGLGWEYIAWVFYFERWDWAPNEVASDLRV